MFNDIQTFAVNFITELDYE